MKKPNWREWLSIPEVRVWQACALSLNIDPHSMEGSPHGWMDAPGHATHFEPTSFPTEAAQREFDLRQRVLIANLGRREFFSPGVLSLTSPSNHGVLLAEFARWAVLTMKWPRIPSALVEMANPSGSQGKGFVREPSQQLEQPRAPTTHKLNTRGDVLDPLIDRAIQQAGSRVPSAVFLALKELALDGEAPFTGEVNGAALGYTKANNNTAFFTKEALHKRIGRRNRAK